MPTLFNFFGMQFFFWSDEHEPIHVHVRKGRGYAKFIVEPEVELAESKGFKPQELKLAEHLIEDNKDVIITNWKVYFNKKGNS
jgi:hypothetical protein